ncbi:TetR/AcrR family transcriptional regulator [Maricaulaceae bacterium NA33B04]|nr:TetR/AcrR family transcriptional regulator [Maricaulaceae bacterium NA33B04]
MLDDSRSKGLRERKKEALRETLYKTALRLFRESSFETVPVSAICEEAGVAKGTFFNHFPTKDHILLEWYSRMTYVGNAVETPAQTVYERVIALTNAFFDICLADPDLWRAKLQRMSLNEDFRNAERDSDARSREILRQILSAGIDSGEIDPRHDPGVHADLMLAMMTGTVHDWTINGSDFDIRKKVDERLKAFLSALAKRD